MILSLSVKNFAIIEDVSVSFDKGMTVLTGETGAGKSLIIDTILLLLGARADSDMIRYNTTKAEITGVFTYNNIFDELFNKYNIPVIDTITIHREIFDSSRNIIKINDTSITLAALKQIANLLADIHVQNDTYRLFNPDNYLEFLDPKSDSKFDKLITNYSKALYEYNNKLDTYTKVVKKQHSLEEKLEFLEYEREELESLELYPNIDKELEEKIEVLSNFDKIHNNLIEGYNLLNNEYNPLDMIYDAAKALEKISAYKDDYAKYNSTLLDAYYNASEISDLLSNEIKSLDYDEEELNLLIEQNNNITKAKEKYKKSVDELISYLQQITLELEMANNYDEVLKETKEAVISSYNSLIAEAKKLTDYRKKLAIVLEKNVISECKDLDLDNTNFKVEFNNFEYNNPFDKSIFTENGTDIISFMISFNKGEPLKMLHKVASGGEMSRIMLAFKSILSKSSNLSLMVFDEIDTGVSGSTAKKIAKKMYEISKNIQVLCITHLPQVAAYGDNHKKIYKVLENNRTYTKINDLSYEQKIEEIAVMLSGDKVSLYALEHAKQLLNKA